MKKIPCRTCGTHRCAHKRGGRIRAKSLTREHQQWARKHVRRESLQKSGALGFARLASKYGMQYATERVAKWRRAHPSSIERTVMGWLDELRERYEHDRPFRGFLVYPDLQLHERRIVIEVDGAYWHRNSAVADAEKDALYRREGYRVVRLCESCVKDGTGKRTLVRFIQDYSMG